ncbi:C2H2-like zinc finger protein [Quillaja saponaria]|uniref:C2H2-like zinc finger protein n=1 Tax=Quillaja saponaria TaxID=32244 RepID=A0AAD7M1V5_QUISA|nr:C2H2-like zinc finger protein [Quillaja saponaria]
MPVNWNSLKRSLNCKTELSEVHDPQPHISIDGSKRQERPRSCSPTSKRSSDILNPIIHKVVLDNSSCNSSCEDIQFCPCCPSHRGDGGGKNGSTSAGGLMSRNTGRHYKPRTTPATSSSVSHNIDCDECTTSLKSKTSFVETDSNISSPLICHKCSEQFRKLSSVEEHHISKHSVTLLHEGDSSWQIIETICRTSWCNSDNNSAQIDSVLKVHNSKITLAWFEDYREMVKIKDSRLDNKNPRCQADGNELLKFHGTTVACSLGVNGSSSLCTLDHCGICQILRHGFSAKKELNGSLAVFTASSSGKVFESIALSDENTSIRKALILCRVIAGRVQSHLEEIQEMPDSLVFDSLDEKVCCPSKIDKLCVLNPRALLPCFVVIYKS